MFGTPVIVTTISGGIIEDEPQRWSLTMRAIDFWYEFASTYSYVTAMCITQAAAKAGVAVRWRPFLLGPSFKELGWNDSPFNIYTAKGQCMWRDLARVCDDEGLPLALPPMRFPQNGLDARLHAWSLHGELCGATQHR